MILTSGVAEKTGGSTDRSDAQGRLQSSRSAALHPRFVFPLTILFGFVLPKLMRLRTLTNSP
jgi:hypothetical protein